MSKALDINYDFTHKKRTRLNYKYSIEIQYHKEVMQVIWSPYVPDRMTRKLRDRYLRARDDFMQEMASILDGNTMVIDGTKITSFKALVRH